MQFFTRFILLFLIGSIVLSCFDDLDDVPKISSTSEINDFVWRGMNSLYLYKSDVPDLSNTRFSSDKERSNYLNQFSDPKGLFNALKSDIDKFSWIVSDYEALELSLNGITQNNGMDFGIKPYPNNENKVYGYVRYVLPNTDAVAKNLKRGMIFTTIDGIELTQENYRNLLRSDTYTIGLANFDGNNFEPTGVSITLQKEQYEENPIFIHKTIELNDKKIGYLMYNAFTPRFDSQLNQVFAQFRSDGVTDLVLDVRYNGGGNVETAIDLSSMITGQFEGQIFSRNQWNNDQQGKRGKIRSFNSTINSGETINSLNLNKVYILTSQSSASASELIINSLAPYISVVQIGDTTRGKFQASITVYDSKNFGRLRANIGHRYAMQPLVLKSINAAGVTDYFDGIAPDILALEDTSNPNGISNLGVLGEASEPLLATALEQITGVKKYKTSASFIFVRDIGERNMFYPSYQKMYIP